MHVVTDDVVLARPDFVAVATGFMSSGGPLLALHVRGHATRARVLYEHAARLRRASDASGAMLFVNDRIDVALAASADGVQLGRRSAPIRPARSLLTGRTIGYSAHSATEAGDAFGEGADFVVLGSIFASPTHAGSAGAGLALIRSTIAAAGGPIVAIGGVTPERIAEVAAAGAAGVAVLSGVWGADRPYAAVEAFLAAADVFEGRQREETQNDADD